MANQVVRILCAHNLPLTFLSYSAHSSQGEPLSGRVIDCFQSSVSTEVCLQGAQYDAEAVFSAEAIIKQSSLFRLYNFRKFTFVLVFV